MGLAGRIKNYPTRPRRIEPGPEPESESESVADSDVNEFDHVIPGCRLANLVVAERPGPAPPAERSGGPAGSVPASLGKEALA